MFSIDDAIAMIPGPGSGSAAILTIERVSEGGPSFRRLPINAGLGVELRATVREVLIDIRSHIEDAYDQPVLHPYSWGHRFGTGRLGVFDGGAADLAPRLNAHARGNRDRDPEGGELTARPDDRVRAYALTIQGGSDRVTIVRKRDPLRRYERTGLLAFWDEGNLNATRFVFAYDGGWDAVIMNEDVLVANASAFEALFGDEEVIEASLDMVRVELSTLIPDADAISRLISDEHARERLRNLRPGFAATLRDGRARAAIRAFELDDVRIDGNGRIAFGRSNAAKAQLLRLLEDGYLLSEVSATRYSARAKDTWPPRRIVTGVRKDNGRIDALMGEGNWSPRNLRDVATDIANGDYRYAVANSTGHVTITHRASGGDVVLHAFDEDSAGRRNDLLTTLPDTT